MKTYRIRDVRKYTGLSRKQIFDYSKSIKPVGVENDANYKIYDEEGLEKLSIAALLSNLGAGPQKINEIFSRENLDREKVINELISEAKDKIQELEDIITVADYIKGYNFKGVTVNPLELSTLHETATLIKEELNSPEYIRLGKNLEKRIDDLVEIYKKMCSDYDKYGEEIPEEDFGELITFITNELEYENWPKFFTGQVVNLNSLESYIAYIDGRIRKGSAETILTLIGSYQANHLFNDLEPILLDDEFDEELENRNYESETIRNSVKEIIGLFSKWYGYKSEEEILQLLTFLQYAFEQEEDYDDYFDCLFEAIQRNIPVTE